MSPPNEHDREPETADREIHRLFDGDLTAEEAGALLRAQKDPRVSSGTRVKLEALGDLRALVRAATSDEDEPIDSEAAWAQIAARIEGRASAEVDARASSPKIGAATGRPALRVIQGGLGREDADAKTETPGKREAQRDETERAESAPPGLLQRVDRASADRDAETRKREQQVRQRRTLIMMVSGLAAAAAAAIAFLGPGNTPTDDPVVAVHEPDPTSQPTIDPVADDTLRRTEVLAVDFGANAGTVFSVEGSEGARYAVVWLTDESDKTDAPSDTTNKNDPSGSESL